MGIINKTYESLLSWTVDLTTYLSDRGFAATDITDIVFTIKSSRDIADSGTAEVWKTLGDADLTLDTDTNLLTIPWLAADYTSLEYDTIYHIAIGVKFTGDTIYDELNLEDASVKITRDVIRG